MKTQQKQVVSYVRVSTSGQDHASQRLAIEQWCVQNGLNIEKEFCDTMSGMKKSRPQFDRMMAEAEKGKIGTIVVFKLDRLGRSMCHVSKIAEDFRKWGVDLVCTSQPIDTRDNNPCGKLIFGILISCAEFERDMIVERTKAGLAVARAGGKQIGRKPGFGRDLPVAEYEKMLADGIPYRVAAKTLGFPASTMRNAFNRAQKLASA